ncbi:MULTISPECIES: diaminopropionate ammonia-lyase [unclassified Polaromonas]|uniref:diaminopropionate ammonia-lyase n=1 Tax=unclassified Polaromonas TaxID=2638319 RepID=UPI000F0739FD|nr:MULTISPECIES: diaminopropionate ammonia-lyase [unclassified Polaromonas]AYQ28918.1 diaminopropionate ammonia-lyase [Polaromonas sp. SP1]QGJ19965.1 diaminopropionate ammonia-lyase [Polaromonas sp. Pch-P]
MLIHNRFARRSAYDAALQQVMNIAQARESRRWLSHWPVLNPGATLVWQMPHLAQRLQVGRVSVKDESARSPLGSFKVLGAPVALLRLIMRRWPGKDFKPEDLLAGRHAQDLKDFVVISATDGNHGRALAAAAQSVGCRCVIVLHAHVSLEREAPITALGAEIVRITGNYDASVQEAARLAAANDWQVVSDTSYEGYEEIPRDVMQGYAAMVDELLEPDLPLTFTHVILQGGVGGLAAGVVSYFWERYGEQRPGFIVVEPEQADCLYQSAKLGRPATATGSVDSVMAGLACGETSPLAWRFLQPAVDFFITVSDEQAVDAMRTLASGEGGDVPVLSGESGAAGLAALNTLAASPELRRQTGLNSDSRVLLINTEGATAPAVYAQLAGLSPQSVLAAQADWLARLEYARPTGQRSSFSSASSRQ